MLQSTRMSLLTNRSCIFTGAVLINSASALLLSVYCFSVHFLTGVLLIAY